MTEHFDVVVLGLGPGGEEAAGKLAEEGLSVAAVEANLVGGECPYWGCVPSKMMIRAADALAEGRRIPVLAGAATVVPDWAPVAARIRDEATDDWDDRAAAERLARRGATLVRGTGRLDGPGAVVVGDRRLEAGRAVLLNPGTKPWAPPIPGLDLSAVWTNRQAVETEVVPDSLLVLGGGAIGLELAQVFARFGSAVTVVEVADRLLAVEEPESSALVTEVFEREGLAVHTGVEVAEVVVAGDRATLRLGSGAALEGRRLLVATGRRPDLGALGIETVGLDPGARALPVDDHLRLVPGVWAIGDATAKGAFTHISMYQSAIAVADILGRDHVPADYRALPRVTFTDPEVGAVGQTEAQARADGLAVRTSVTPIPESTRGWIHKVGNEGFIKLVADDERQVLVGATSAGPAGGEVLGLLALAVHAQVPLATLRSMIYAYPTFHRAVEAALAGLE